MKQEVTLTPTVDLKRCSGCNKCVVACKNNALELIDINAPKGNNSFFRLKKYKAILKKPENCSGCKICASVCRHKAISFQ
jgi:4Fe-4S ferredoxin